MRSIKIFIIVLMMVAAMIVLFPNMVVTYQLGYVPNFMYQIDLDAYRELFFASLGLWGLILSVIIHIDGIHQIKITKRNIRWIGTILVDLFCIVWSVIFLIVLSINNGWEVTFMFLSLLWLFTLGIPIGMIIQHNFYPHYDSTMGNDRNEMTK